MITSILLGLALGFALTQIANFATTVYLHRALSHRALSLSAPLRIPFRLVIWITTGIRPRQWVAVHRKHHAHTDEDDDPHSPARLGWVRVQLLNVSLYRRHARDAETVEKYAKDLPQTRLDRWVLDHALVGLGLLFVALLAVFGLTVAAIAWTFHVVLYLALSGSINAIAHTFGRRPFQTSATNVQWLAFVLPFFPAFLLSSLFCLLHLYLLSYLTLTAMFFVASILFCSALYRFHMKPDFQTLLEVGYVVRMSQAGFSACILPILVFAGIFVLALPLYGVAFFIGFLLLIAQLNLYYRFLELKK